MSQSETKKRLFAEGKLVPWNKGVPITEDHREKLREIARHYPKRSGYELTTETKEKITASLRAFANTPEKLAIREEKAKAKRQAILDLQNQWLMEYRDRALEIGFSIEEFIRKEKLLILRCLGCGSISQRTKQALEPSKYKATKCRVCFPKSTASEGQIELTNFIKSLGVDVISEDRSILGGKEIDTYLPNFKLGFEYNGLYWHSAAENSEPKHLLWKKQFAYNKGVRLIHIFEDEWLNKQEIVESRIKSLLGMSNRLYARNTKIVHLEANEKNIFLSENHMQGSDVTKIRYGLTLNDELVSVMTFKPSSPIKGGDGSVWELSRFASKLGVTVVGGASKLLKAFITDHDPEVLISYADRRWSDGNVYEKLGFKFEHASKPCHWYFKSTSLRYHRSKFMKHKLVKLGADSQLTEQEIMKKQGYNIIWDCGTLKFSMKCK
jgi:hypothetical protein